MIKRLPGASYICRLICTITVPCCCFRDLDHIIHVSLLHRFDRKLRSSSRLLRRPYDQLARQTRPKLGHMTDNANGQLIRMETLKRGNDRLQQLRIQRAEPFVEEKELQWILPAQLNLCRECQSQGQ